MLKTTTCLLVDQPGGVQVRGARGTGPATTALGVPGISRESGLRLYYNEPTMFLDDSLVTTKPPSQAIINNIIVHVINRVY